MIKGIRNSAIADKPRDAFRGQSRSPNMVPFRNVRYGFLLVCYSNFVPKSRRISDIQLKNVVTLNYGSEVT